MATASINCPAVPLEAEHPLFILYTSGSTGKPKGILHTTGGYIVYVANTYKFTFNYQANDIYWCTADIGWITGHSYGIYGPLINGATSLLFEGTPTYPTPARLWEIVDSHKVSIFYTSPTLLRSLMAKGTQYLSTSTRNSLRVLGSVGEPINPEAWQWYYQYVGNSKCEIVDTWWQTETGGFLISPLAGITKTKPGCATKPFFGIAPVILNEQGEQLSGEATGILAIANSWPGQARSIYGDHTQFVKTYFSQYPGYYFTGDCAKCDVDGYFWITGRIDDVINVSGHRLCSAEIENTLTLHPHVAESAVVGMPHTIKGECISAFIKLIEGVQQNKELIEELIKLVRKEIGSIATPENLHFVTELPKTRSGKIMRRILRKIAMQDIADLGDISTLVDPNIINEIILNKTSLNCS
jgi:acetyl-CoA synthetase